MAKTTSAIFSHIVLKNIIYFQHTYMHYFRLCMFTGANMKKNQLYDINRKYDNAFIKKVTCMYVFE